MFVDDNWEFLATAGQVWKKAYKDWTEITVDLTLKVPIMTAADNIQKYFFYCFSEKIRLDVSSESSARQRIHMKNQAYFFQKIKVQN